MPDAQPGGAVGHLRPGGQKGVDGQASGHLQLAPQGVLVVEEDEVGAGLPAHVGEVPGAQLPGEKDRGLQPVHEPRQLFRREGLAAPGGGGEKEVLRHPLQGQDHPVPAKALPGLLQPLSQGAPGQGGGDHHLGVGGGGPVPLGDVEGQSPLGKGAVQPGGDLLQGRDPPLKVQNGAGKSPGLALLQDLLADGGGLPQTVEAPVAHHHQGAPGKGGVVRPEQVGAGPQAVGQQGGDGAPPPPGTPSLDGGQLPGRERDEKGVHGLRHW